MIRAARRWAGLRKRLASAREVLAFRRSFLLSWLLWPAAWPAAWLWRRTWLRSTRVIAVTGSFGKTSTAAAAAAAVGARFDPDRANYGSFLAAAVLRHRPRRLPLVLEVAISRRGQMRGYARLLRPDVVVLTAVGAEHLGRLGTIAAVAVEKARLVEGLRPAGLLIANGDDERCRAIAARTAGRVVRVGFAADCEQRIARASGDWPRGTHLRLAGPDGRLEIASRWIGRDLARCAAFGAAVGLAAGVEPEVVGACLAEVPPMPWRLEPVPLPGGAWLLCDAWKSTWPTVEAALGELGSLAAGWRRVALLGDVEELLGNRVTAYREYGRLAAAAADRILYVGTGTGFLRLQEGVRRAGVAAPRATEVELHRDWRHAAEALRSELSPGTAILVKGRQRQKLGRVAILLRGGAVRCSLRVCPARGLRCELCPRLG
jgi:UDP-N-acetylmuramoyl-tripeptide--D-alanyl-D-alanine ligase